MNPIQNDTFDVSFLTTPTSNEDEARISIEEIRQTWADCLDKLADPRPSQEELWDLCDRSVTDMVGAGTKWRIAELSFTEPNDMNSFKEKVLVIDQQAQALFDSLEALESSEALSFDPLDLLEAKIERFQTIASEQNIQNTDPDPVVETQIRIVLGDDEDADMGIGTMRRLAADVDSAAVRVEALSRSFLRQAHIQLVQKSVRPISLEIFERWWRGEWEEMTPEEVTPEQEAD